MSFYFRDKPRLSDRLRGRSGDDLLQHIKQQFDEDSKSFFDPDGRTTKRDSFERHAPFLRGFPFDDEDEDNFGRRRDLRAHLDDLAARHPELTEHLSVPDWVESRFHGPQRNQRRRDSGSSSYQGHPDEDARSQASGSSAASAASGASGVSSHDESESRSSRPAQKTKRQPIPQYGLRNTVDIGQHRHDMENNDKDARNQRSMSAPPENRQQVHQQNEQQEQYQPSQGQRFVSRVDITPQHNQKQQQQQQQQPTASPQQQQGNVRHIPIFVEGRDEPVIPKNIDEPHFPRQSSPPHFSRQSPPPPQFQRRSPFGKNWANNRQQWPPQFSDTFYQPQGAFEQPSAQRFYDQRGFGPQGTQPRQQQHNAQRQQPPKQQQQQQMHSEQQPPQPQQQQQQPPPPPPPQEQEPPKPKPLPKDPLERVALVQQEVDSLAAQVKEYTGNSRKDKQYIYLDEMLTRELIKLDDIETEGRENVRQARKNAIKTIQETISLLESKAPLLGQQCGMEQQQEEQLQAQNQPEEKKEEKGLNEQTNNESMETDQTEEKTSNNPIPLPPVPSSSDNTSAENTEEKQNKPEEQNQNTEQTNTPLKEETLNSDNQTSAQNATNSEVVPVTEDQQTEEQQTVQQDKPQQNDAQVITQDGKIEKLVESQPTEMVAQLKQTQHLAEQQQQEAMQVEKQSTPSPKLSKKVKKTQEQTCVSQEPIPLPAPPQNAETK